MLSANPTPTASAAPSALASFNENFDLHEQWRRSYAARLHTLEQWLAQHELADDAVQDRLRALGQQLRSDKVMVAFVAEFSRGKSELINAIFFAAYGKRIMPASAGRTTMCPTELGWDASVPPCLRLLPIETRLEPQALMEWRNAPETWTRIDLDVNDADQLAEAFEKISEVVRVSQEQANALGFWHDEAPEENPPIGADGLVEVPRWRHALINIAHPLLKQGLVILDTPGLNAIGAEPELTVSLIPQADAVVFILGADTGVTKSDLQIWKEHLVGEDENGASHLVVLNKIDAMWDALSTPAQIQRAIEKPRQNTAGTLGITAEQVIPVSAQKGLVAKVNGDAALLQSSQLPLLEQALSHSMLDKRNEILRRNVAVGLTAMRQEVGRNLTMRSRDLTEQNLELSNLRGKNTSVIKHMRARVVQEQGDFSQSGARIHALKSVHMQMLRELFNTMSASRVKDELLRLGNALKEPGLKIGVKKVYADTFGRLAAILSEAKKINADLHNLLQNSFRQMNTEFGFTLQLQDPPDLTRYSQDLQKIENGHLRYLGVSNLLRLNRPEFADRLVKSLSTRLRGIYDAALADVELWNKAAAAQLDAQVRERRRTFTKRVEAIERIQEAAGSLEDRIQEMESQTLEIAQLSAQLDRLSAPLLDDEVGSDTSAGADPLQAEKRLLISD